MAKKTLKSELAKLSVVMSIKLGHIFGTSVSCCCVRDEFGDRMIITNFIKDENNRIELPVDLDKLYLENVSDEHKKK